MKLIAGLLLVLIPACAASIEADSRRGADLFATQKCTTCHSVYGQGQHTAPDLGQRASREYTAAGVASRMWNHAPTMWYSMGKSNIEPPKLTEGNAADLFAFFYATRYFEKRGDAGRGKRVYESKKCGQCHEAGGPGLPVTKWKSAADPIDLVLQMYNHAPQMKEAAAGKNFKWPTMTPDELTDLLVYVENLPANRGLTPQFHLPAGNRGKELLVSKGCTGCHTGAMALEDKLAGQTLTDVAAAMWNHAPKMREKAQTLSSDEMREILAYTWGAQFFHSKGNAAKGARLFSAQCGTCHGVSGSGAPDLASKKGSFSTLAFVSGLWSHGPTMLERMKAKKKKWPNLSPDDVSNLVAFIDAGAK
jgi:mono/diheme cytochrome c family protein